MGSIPLPALSVQPPPQQNPIQGYRDFLAMRASNNQAALAQEEIKGEQTKNAMASLQLQDQQNLRTAAGGIDWSQPDAFDKFLSSAQKSKVSPQTLSSLALQRQQYLEQLNKTDVSGLQAMKERGNQLAGHIDAVLGASPDQKPQVAKDQAQQALDAGLVKDPGTLAFMRSVAAGQVTPTDDQLTHLKNGVLDSTTQADLALKKQQGQESAAKTGESQAAMAAKNAETDFYKNNPGAGAPGVPGEVAQMASFLNQNPGKTPADYPAYKAAQQAKAEQPYKLEQSRVEAQTKQLIEGMEKPVYAFQPDGSKKLMSATDALQAGLRIMTPVGTKEVQDDTMLNNRLADVQQKVTQYEKAFQNANITSKERGDLAALIDHNQLHMGAFGSEVPANRFESMMQRENLKALGPEARDLLVAYRNAAEALVGYQRVLSGSGRSSDQAMQLQQQTMPDPAVSDADFAGRSFKAFKQNIAVAAQGLPIIPGVKSPTDIEKELGTAKSGDSNWGSQFGGVPH